MRLTVVAVGRAGGSAFDGAFRDYARRLNPPLALVEVEERRRLPPPELNRRENERLRAAVPAGALVVALDRLGSAPTSPGLADRLRAWRESGRSGVAFLIGGADGLDDTTRAAADEMLSFGPMTWPHLLARVMLAEQLWRADSILAGHPYHRE